MAGHPCLRISSTRALLLVTEWLAAGSSEVIQLTHSPFSIGRGHENDAVFRGKLISRHHAVITRSGEANWLLEDKSTNGTFVETPLGRIRTERAHSLRTGEEIVLGDDSPGNGIRFRFVAPGAQPKIPRPPSLCRSPTWERDQGSHSPEQPCEPPFLHTNHCPEPGRLPPQPAMPLPTHTSPRPDVRGHRQPLATIPGKPAARDTAILLSSHAAGMHSSPQQPKRDARVGGAPTGGRAAIIVEAVGQGAAVEAARTDLQRRDGSGSGMVPSLESASSSDHRSQASGAAAQLAEAWPPVAPPPPRGAEPALAQHHNPSRPIPSWGIFIPSCPT